MGKEPTKTIQERLFAALAKIDRPGTFCTSGVLSPALPGLAVEGLGTLALPLTPDQAGQLKQLCQPAAYGKGTQTLVDSDVRRAWRLPPARVKIGNPAFAAALAAAVEKVQEELGLAGQKLQAHLYELLLYEKGSFFLPHRDGEKLQRMVATLIVVLPSEYEGGELVVRHEGQTQVLDLAAQDAHFQSHFAAFYADCEHEVRPLRSGYRLCLVYNLTLVKGKKSIAAPRSQEHVQTIAQILRSWPPEEGAPAKLAVTLEHRYTQKGLAWDALKGVDRARARILAQAAEQAGCHAYLALVTLWETGSASGFDYEPRWRRGRGQRPTKSGKHEMEEVFDESLSARHWLDPDGRRPRFGELPVERDQIVPEESLTAIKPKEVFEGYTGNAGMTLERWYRHAAIVLWPDARHFDVLCEAGCPQAVPALTRMVSAWRKTQGQEAAAQKQPCLALAEKILAGWPAQSYRGYGPVERRSALDPMRPLRQLGERQLIRTYLSDVLVKDAALEPGSATVLAILDQGWETFRPELQALVESTSRETIERNVRLLDRLCIARLRRVKKSQDKAARETCRIVADGVVVALNRIDAERAPPDWQASRIDRAQLLARLARALLAAGFEEPLSQLVAHSLYDPKLYSVRKVHVPALTKIGPWLKKNLKQRSPALARWIAASEAELKSLTAAPPEPPADFRREAKVTCDCQDCAELNRFLRDPREGQHSFQMAQHRRSHLESEIRTAHCDLDCTTNKRPRPQILICTKNLASYQRERNEYHENLQHLETLRSIGRK